MNRNILSVLLLSVYTLLLLHDFIPHTHQHGEQKNSTSSIHHHSYEGNHHDHDHHHNHEHHEKNDTDDRSDSSDNNLLGDHSLDSQSHSHPNGHQHDFTHRTVVKTDFVPELLTFEYLPVDLWKLPDRLDDYYSIRFLFLDSFTNPNLSSGQGLRGPPALS
ncbi:MAG: hypothetical protein COA32_17405 [Fluviicola sp.]|nr:MAG: hypothetical protein COA32_17405 [Fluviicola sp.]